MGTAVNHSDRKEENQTNMYSTVFKYTLFSLSIIQFSIYNFIKQNIFQVFFCVLISENFGMEPNVFKYVLIIFSLKFMPEISEI
jgi:hypothetical protein